MTKDTHPQTADGNPTNSRFNLKRKFLGNIIIMSTLLTTFVPLPVDAYYNRPDSEYEDIGCDTWSNGNVIEDSYKENKEKTPSTGSILKNNRKKTPQNRKILKNDRGNPSVSDSGLSGLFMLAVGAVIWYFWPSKNKNTTKSTVCQRQRQNNDLCYNNWEMLYGNHVISTEPKIDFYTDLVIKLDSEDDDMNWHTKAENNLDGNKNKNGGKKKNINLYNKPDADFGANYTYPPCSYSYAQQNMGVGGPLFYQGAGINGYPYNMNNPLFYQGAGINGYPYNMNNPLSYQGAGINGYPYNMNNPLFYQGAEGNKYYTLPNMGGGNPLFGNGKKDNDSTYNTRSPLFGNGKKDNDSTYNTRSPLFGNGKKDNDSTYNTRSPLFGNGKKDNDSTYNTRSPLFGNGKKDNDYESRTEGSTQGNQHPPAVAKENLLRAQKEQYNFFNNLIQGLEKNKNVILNSIKDLNKYLDSLLDIIKVAKENPSSNELLSDLPVISEKLKQIEESFNDIYGIIDTSLSKAETFLANPQLLKGLNNSKCQMQKKGHEAIENIYNVFNAMLNDKMDGQNNEKALERDLAECVEAFDNLSKALQNLNMVNNTLLGSVEKYRKELL